MDTYFNVDRKKLKDNNVTTFKEFLKIMGIPENSDAAYIVKLAWDHAHSLGTNNIYPATQSEATVLVSVTPYGRDLSKRSR